MHRRIWYLDGFALVLMRKADLNRLPMPDLLEAFESAVLCRGVLGSDWSTICCVDRFDLKARHSAKPLSLEVLTHLEAVDQHVYRYDHLRQSIPSGSELIGIAHMSNDALLAYMKHKTEGVQAEGTLGLPCLVQSPQFVLASPL